MVLLRRNDISVIRSFEYKKAVARNVYRSHKGFLVEYGGNPYLLESDGKNAILCSPKGFYDNKVISAYLSEELYDYLSLLVDEQNHNGNAKLKPTDKKGTESLITNNGFLLHSGSLGFVNHEEYPFQLCNITTGKHEAVPSSCIIENEKDGFFYLRDTTWKVSYYPLYRCFVCTGYCEYDYPCYYAYADQLSDELIFEFIQTVFDCSRFITRDSLITEVRKIYDDALVYIDCFSNNELLGLVCFHNVDHRLEGEFQQKLKRDYELDFPLFF